MFGSKITNGHEVRDKTQLRTQLLCVVRAGVTSRHFGIRYIYILPFYMYAFNGQIRSLNQNQYSRLQGNVFAIKLEFRSQLFKYYTFRRGVK